MNARAVTLAASLVAAAALAAAIVLRRRALAQAERGLIPLAPFNPDAPVRISPGAPLVIADNPYIAAPRELGVLDQISIAVGDAIGPAVDQIVDGLKGLGLWSRKVPERFRALFAMTGSQYRLPPGLLEAVAYRESRFRDDIISGKLRSSAGAVGIMQIVPRFHPEIGEAGALDPLRAVPYAARFLRQLFEQFGNWKHAVAAYNWGPTALANALKRNGKWPTETIDYVAEIAANAGLA